MLGKGKFYLTGTRKLDNSNIILDVIKKIFQNSNLSNAVEVNVENENS